MERVVRVKDVHHHQASGLIEIVVQVEEFDGDSYTTGAVELHSVNAHALAHGWNGSIDAWLSWVKEKHLTSHELTAEVKSRLMALRGQTL